MSDIYRFRCGTCPLKGRNIFTSIPGERHAFNLIGINHHCLLLNRDIFEYGNKGYRRLKDVEEVKILIGIISFLKEELEFLLID